MHRMDVPLRHLREHPAELSDSGVPHVVQNRSPPTLSIL
jgi:hypothetical protein